KGYYDLSGMSTPFCATSTFFLYARNVIEYNLLKNGKGEQLSYDDQRTGPAGGCIRLHSFKSDESKG
ncbi:MAG TPA: hypothetical protein IAA28_04365, partial [Candidatus Lachnoclostridium stercoripullorum]|nr:hypothetical protein [Candidatus Lachnoclostridium stercoripullorum]